MLTFRRLVAFMSAGILIGVLTALVTDRMGGTADSDAIARSMVWLAATFLWIGVAWWLFAPRKVR